MTRSLEDRRELARERAWIHHPGEEHRIQLLELIRDQDGMVRKGISPGCAVCLIQAPMHKLYRCFFCDLWLCPMCSRVHFAPGAEHQS